MEYKQMMLLRTLAASVAFLLNKEKEKFDLKPGVTRDISPKGVQHLAQVQDFLDELKAYYS